MTKSADGRPLITFALLTYNQEKFIAEAIHGALIQDYEPLEILIFDDASSDQTFEIAKQVTSKYRGPHTIHVMQHSRNLGLVGNVNSVLAASNGELIVLAAGDDISTATRTRKIFDFWCGSGRPSFMYSGTIRIDLKSQPIQSKTPQGKLIERMSAQSFLEKWPNVTGAASAFHRDVYVKFGPLNPKTLIEDRSLAFRGILLNGIKYISEDLVLYRTSGISDSSKFSTSIESKLSHRYREMKWVESFNQQAKMDLQVAPQEQSIALRQECCEISESSIKSARFIQRLMTMPWISRVGAIGDAISVYRQTRRKIVLREFLKLSTIYANFQQREDHEGPSL